VIYLYKKEIDMDNWPKRDDLPTQDPIGDTIDQEIETLQQEIKQIKDNIDAMDKWPKRDTSLTQDLIGDIINQEMENLQLLEEAKQIQDNIDAMDKFAQESDEFYSGLFKRAINPVNKIPMFYKRKGDSIFCRERYIFGSSDDGGCTVTIPDGFVLNSPSVGEKHICEHKNMKKVVLSKTLKYWYCPDCKKDLGDA
jgi:hypothetical protein